MDSMLPSSHPVADSLLRENLTLRAKMEQLDLALRAAAMGVWDWNLTTGRLEWAAEHAALFGIQAADFGGTLDDVQACVHPDDREQGMEAVQRTLNEGAEFDNIYRVVWPDGSIHWLHSLGRLIRDAENHPQRIVGITWDITEERQAEQQMAALSAVVKHSDAIIVVKDLDLRVIATNTALAEVAGYASERALIGKTDAEIFRVSPESEPVRSYMADDRAAQQLPPGQVILREEPVITADGRTLCYLTKKYPIYDHRHRLIGTGCISVDITKRLEAEQELVAANIEAQELATRAEAASQAKSAFLANMSHEIRTPLNAVLGLARIGLRDNAGRACHQTFAQILEASEHLLGVINDILDYAKIEAGRFTLDRHPFQLSSMIVQASDLVSVTAQDKGLTFRTDMEPNLPDWVIGDEQRVRQILFNLLSNAVKFTDQGEVVLRVSCAGEHVDFAVRDTGIGLSDVEVSRLFQPFEQLDGSPTRKHGGTGLGLVISRNLAHLMNGNILVASTPGMGSTFTLRLPLTVTTAPAKTDVGGRADTTCRLAGLRILAAEDVAVNRLILEDLLIHEGAQVRIAENGREAVDLLSTLGTAEIDLVLMDIQMPEMDGYSTTEHILRLDPRLPIVGLTAHAMAEERARCLAVGMVDHVTKPIDPGRLVSVIRRHARGAQVSSHPAQDWPRASSTSNDQEVTHFSMHLEQVPGIDLPAALARVSGKSELLNRLLHLFADQYRDIVPRMREALDADNPAEARRLAHGLKGVAGNLCISSIHSIAATLDGLLREVKDRNRIESLIQALEKSLDPVVSAIDQSQCSAPHESETL